MKIRLITWNLHALPPPAQFCVQGRVGNIVQEVVRRRPDLLMFQEVWRRSVVSKIAERLSAEGYDRVECARGGRSTGGLLTFHRSEDWTLESCEFTRFERHASWWRVWEGDGLSRKGLLTSVLRQKNSNESITLLNMHLQSQYGSRTYDDIREAQLAQLDARIRNFEKDRIVVAAGDLNTLPADPLYSHLSKRWVDITAEYRRRCEEERGRNCGTYLTGKPANEWVDYVLFRRHDSLTAEADVEMIRNDRRDHPFSDHDGIQVDLRLLRADDSALTRRLLRVCSDGLISRRVSLSILLGRQT